MARKVVWSFESTADLEALADYIAKDSAFYAAAFVQEIRDASRSLKEFSERGRIVPEFSNPNIRELFVSKRVSPYLQHRRITCRYFGSYSWEQKLKNIVGKRKKEKLTENSCLIDCVYAIKCGCEAVIHNFAGRFDRIKNVVGKYP